MAIRPKSTLTLTKLSRFLIELNRLDEAEAAAKRAIEIDKKFEMGHVVLGYAFFLNGKKEQGIALMRKALQIRPGYAYAHGYLGWALTEDGKLNEAIEHYKKSLKFKSSFGHLRNNYIRLLKNAGMTDEAKLEAKNAIEMVSDSAYWHGQLARSMVYIGMNDEAIDECNKAINIDSEFEPAYFYIGEALNKQGNTDEAINAFRMAVRIVPSTAYSRNALGYCLKKKGKVDEAIVQFQLAIEIDPTYKSAFSNLGTALFQKGNVNEAIDKLPTMIPKAYQLEPKQRHLLIGTLLIEMEKFDEAINELSEACRVDPNNYRPHSGLADCYYKKREFRKAAIAARKAIDLGENSANAFNSLACDLVTSPDATEEEATQGIEAAERALTLTPKNANITQTLGMGNYRKGDWNVALKIFNDSIRFGMDAPHNWLFIAMCHWQLGDKKQSLHWYNKSLRWREGNTPGYEMEWYFEEAAELIGEQAAIENAPSDDDANATPLDGQSSAEEKSDSNPKTDSKDDDRN